MARIPAIFAKRRLTAGQLRAVAERRFADAECLLDSGDPERANGAIYMAGFVIKCLLKALLLERHPNLNKPVDPAKLSKSDREIFGFLYGHDLDQMLGALRSLPPSSPRSLRAKGRAHGPNSGRFASIGLSTLVTRRFQRNHPKLETF